MNDFLLKSLVIYLSAISIAGVCACILDKIKARFGSAKRIAEKYLFFLAAVGGAAAMYLCMLVIRHKTRHVRFMLGFPVIIILQAVLIYLALTR